MDYISLSENFAKERYLLNDDKHQWQHIQDVMKRAMEIVSLLDVDIDLEILKISIIFHDIDYESYNTHVDASVLVAEMFLSENNYPKKRVELVKEVMLDHSTPHRKIRGEAQTIEGKIIYDADKSIFITEGDTYKKYYPLLYLSETKKLVEEQLTQ